MHGRHEFSEKRAPRCRRGAVLRERRRTSGAIILLLSLRFRVKNMFHWTTHLIHAKACLDVLKRITAQSATRGSVTNAAPLCFVIRIFPPKVSLQNTIATGPTTPKKPKKATKKVKQKNSPSSLASVIHPTTNPLPMPPLSDKTGWQRSIFQKRPRVKRSKFFGTTKPPAPIPPLPSCSAVSAQFLGATLGYLVFFFRLSFTRFSVSAGREGGLEF